MPAERRVHLVEDPDDSRPLAKQIDATASRLDGRVVLHPTPGLTTSRQLAADLLVSLGKRFDALQNERAGPRAWALVDVWTCAEQVQHLFVLRAHTLGPKRWQELLDLGRRRKIHLWFIVHPGVPARTHACLANVSYRRWDPASFSARWRDIPAADDVVSAAVDLPEVPAEDFVTFRSACRRLLDAAAFERVDRVFCDSMDRTAVDLEPWRVHLRRPPPPTLEAADVAAQLQALLVTSSGPREALVRLRGAQAAYFKTGWLLNFRPPLIPSDSGLVPLGPSLDSAIAARLRRLCDPRSTAAMALFLIADLRSHRLASLDLGDIDADGGAVAVAHRTQRFVVPDYARSLIRAQLAERNQAGAAAADPLFIHPRTGSRQLASALRNVLRATSMKTAIAVGVNDSFGSQRNPAEWIRAQGITLNALRRVPATYP